MDWSPLALNSTVVKGQKVGVAGNTGDSEGSHLHLTVITTGVSAESTLNIRNTFNPLIFYTKNGLSFQNN